MFKLKTYLNQRPNNIPLLELRYFSLLQVVHLLALICHILFLVIFTILEVKELVYVQFLSIPIFSFCIYLNRKRQYLLSVVIGALEVILHQGLCVYMIGVDSEYHMFLTLTAMLPYLLPRGNNLIKAFLLFASILGILFIQYNIGSKAPIYNLNAEVLELIDSSNIC